MFGVPPPTANAHLLGELLPLGMGALRVFPNVRVLRLVDLPLGRLAAVSYAACAINEQKGCKETVVQTKAQIRWSAFAWIRRGNLSPSRPTKSNGGS